MALTESGLTNISNGDGWISQVKLDTDKVFVTYGDGVDTFGRTIDISGGTIDAGAEQEIWDSDYVTFQHVAPISASQVVMVANDDNTDVEIRTIDVSGTVLTSNAAGTIESTNGSQMRVAMATGGSIGACFYLSAETGNPTNVCRFTIAGGTVTPGTVEALDGTATSHIVIGACEVDADRVFVAYKRDTGDNELMVQVVDISSSTLSKGTAVQVDTNAKVGTDTPSPPQYSCEKIDTDKILLVWDDITEETAKNGPSAIIINLDGTTIDSQGDKFKVVEYGSSGDTFGVSILNSTTAIVAYTNDTSSDPVSVVTLDVQGSGITSNVDDLELATISNSGASSRYSVNVTAVSTDQFIATLSEKTSDDVPSSIITTSGLTELRQIAMATDDTYLYVTQNKGEQLQVVYYNLTDLEVVGSHAFGAATYTELDDRDRGIYPARVPNAARRVYIYGRDGNDVQVNFNDLNGTLGWNDVGAGTATWSTADFAVALMVDPLDNLDVIVAMDDDDIYRTEDGTLNWVKMGDAPTDLRAGLRITLNNNEMLLGGTAAGTIHYTNNYGVSFGVASDASLGTINWFEESR